MPNYENVILLLNMAIFDEGICVEYYTISTDAIFGCPYCNLHEYWDTHSSSLEEDRPSN